jgi:putative transposase
VRISAGAAYDLGYQVVWCPKCRRSVLAGRAGERCRELIEGKCAGRGWRAMACEVMPGHVRLLMKAHPKDSPAFIGSQLKGFTSRRLREELPWLRSRLPALWSRSYFAASAGAVSAATVRRYIDPQHERPWRKERPQ